MDESPALEPCQIRLMAREYLLLYMAPDGEWQIVRLGRDDQCKTLKGALDYWKERRQDKESSLKAALRLADKTEKRSAHTSERFRQRELRRESKAWKRDAEDLKKELSKDIGLKLRALEECLGKEAR